jgi:lipoprotein-releasing system permease protein
MFKPLELFIGLRYTRARRKGRYVSFISLASMLGIAIGVLVLITTLSIMNGFEQAMRERILGMLSHITVSSTTGEIQDWQYIRETMMQFPGVTGAAPYIQKEVMLSEEGEVRGVLLQGILPDLQGTVGTIDKHMTHGSFADLKSGEYGIALGETLAKELKLKIGDFITVLSPRSVSPDSNEFPILREFKLVATYRLDMKMYDSTTAFIHMEDATEMLEIEGGKVSGVRLQLEDLFDAPAIRDLIYESSSADTWVIDWTQQNSNFFKAIKMQKTVMFFILIMLVAVAAFNLVSTLVMVVTDKAADIAILRTLGLSPGGVMRIFMVQGSFIGLFGTLIGVVLGIVLTLNLETIVPLIEQATGSKLVSEDVYFISKIQGVLDIKDVIVIALSAFVMAMLATLYPSWKASKLQPAESLRYE